MMEEARVANHILIVDDEPDELSAWRRTLAPLGHPVDTTTSAAEALRMCEEVQYDLVILDYVMPRMKGLELLARIRKKLPLVRSILISGKLNDTLTQKELRDSIREEVETDQYLRKPVSNPDLIEAVTTLLRASESDPWHEMGRKFVQAHNMSVRKAKSAQARLKMYLRKK